jgi:hypothetical protein
MTELLIIIFGAILAIFGIVLKDNKKKSKIISEQKEEIRREQVAVKMHEAQAELAQVAQAEINEVQKSEVVQIEEIKKSTDQEAIDIANDIVNSFNKRMQNP